MYSFVSLESETARESKESELVIHAKQFKVVLEADVTGESSSPWWQKYMSLSYANDYEMHTVR